MRFGLQFKLTALIVALITAVIGSLAFYVAREKKQVLMATASATARKELASLAFIASRAILDRDDLALADSLQNAQGLPGFAVGAVYTPAKKAPLISRVGKTLGDKQKEIERDALETVRAEWENIFGLQPGYNAENRKTKENPTPKDKASAKDKKPEVQNSSVATATELLKIVEKPYLGDKSVKIQYFHKAVFIPSSKSIRLYSPLHRSRLPTNTSTAASAKAGLNSGSSVRDFSFSHSLPPTCSRVSSSSR